MKKIGVFAVSLCALSMLASCGGNSSSSATGGDAVDLKDRTVTFVGSTSVQSMSEDLTAAWINTFSASNRPEAVHNHTGSGDAFKKLEDGTGDVGFASREFNESEKTADYENGKICADGIAVIVNTANTEVTQITLQQLRDIYVAPEAIADKATSEENFGADYSNETPITDWSQIASGASGAIKPYTRDTSSGTRDGFCTKIGIEDAKTNDDLLTDAAGQVATNGEMISSVESTENGIGYCSLEGLSTHEKLKTLKVSSDGTTYVEATEENIKDGSYPLQRNFNYMYPKATSEDRDEIQIALIQSFIAFMNSLDGDSIVKAAGGVLTDIHTETYAEIKEDAAWAETLGL